MPSPKEIESWIDQLSSDIAYLNKNYEGKKWAERKVELYEGIVEFLEQSEGDEGEEDDDSQPPF